MGLVPRDAVSSDYPFEHHVLHHVPLLVDDRQFPVAVRRVRTLVVLFGDRASSRFGFYDDAVCVNVITTSHFFCGAHYAKVFSRAPSILVLISKMSLPFDFFFSREKGVLEDTRMVATSPQVAPLGCFDRSLLVAPKPRQLEKAPLSLREIREAIPAHLFDFNPWLSVYYIARDLCQIAVVVAVTYYLLEHVSNTFIRAAIWVVYAGLQGTTCFGLWVIGHECGHQAYFGKHGTINDAVGFAIHTALLVPYHNWRISHGTHHRYTNNREKDTAFPEFTKPMRFWPLITAFPPAILLNIAGYLLLGWPGYLFLNLEGNVFEGGYTNHFNPESPYFKPSERHLIIGSNIGVATLFSALCVVAYKSSVGSVLCWYGSVWLVCHMWLVLVTLLQHSDPRAPHYDNEDWDFVRGALSTIDRDYSSVLNNWLHHITNGHVVHHLFSTMPFYHAIQATPFVKKALGENYQHDERPLFVQMCHAFFAHQASWQHNPIWLRKEKEHAPVRGSTTQSQICPTTPSSNKKNGRTQTPPKAPRAKKAPSGLSQ